jgi:hypothetical protein
MKPKFFYKCPLLLLIVALSCNQTSPDNKANSDTANGKQSADTVKRQSVTPPVAGAGSQPSRDTVAMRAAPPPEKGIISLSCKFIDASRTSCLRLLFSCGDFGAANISLLNHEQRKLWESLLVKNDDGVEVGNPEYVGRTFEITYGMMEGAACDAADGNKVKPAIARIQNILSFQLVTI